MTLFSYKKFICFSLPLLVLFLNPIFAEQLLTKSEILRKANECFKDLQYNCLLYTSDAADEGLGVDLGGRRIIKKK